MASFICAVCGKEFFTGFAGAAKYKCIKCGAIQCAMCSHKAILERECGKCAGTVKSV